MVWLGYQSSMGGLCVLEDSPCNRRYRFMNFRGCQIRARYCIVEVEVGFRVVAQNMATAVVDLTCVTRYRKPLVRKDAAQRFDWLMQGEYNRWDRRVRVP